MGVACTRFQGVFVLVPKVQSLLLDLQFEFSELVPVVTLILVSRGEQSSRLEQSLDTRSTETTSLLYEGLGTRLPSI